MQYTHQLKHRKCIQARVPTGIFKLVQKRNFNMHNACTRLNINCSMAKWQFAIMEVIQRRVAMYHVIVAGKHANSKI